MKTTSRRYVLDLLRKNKSATAGELALMLGCTPSNVRHHLDQLMGDGLVEIIKIKKQMKRGRPVQVYAPSSPVVENAMEELASILLDLTVKKQPGKYGLVEVVQRMTGTENDSSRLSSSQRLTPGINRMNKLNYKAHWEAGPLGPMIIFGNCPYKNIVGRHPELCQMDSMLLQELMRTGIHQKAKLEEDEKGIRFCSFVTT